MGDQLTVVFESFCTKGSHILLRVGLGRLLALRCSLEVVMGREEDPEGRREGLHQRGV
jgi:hypothetical protein